VGRCWWFYQLPTLDTAKIPKLFDAIEVEGIYAQFLELRAPIGAWRNAHPDVQIQLRLTPTWTPPTLRELEDVVSVLHPQSFVLAIGDKGEMWKVDDTPNAKIAAGILADAYTVYNAFLAQKILPVGIPAWLKPSGMSDADHLQAKSDLAWHYCQFAAAAGVTLGAYCWGNDEKWLAAADWMGDDYEVPHKVQEFEFANLWAVPPAQRALEPGSGQWQKDPEHFERMLEQAQEIEAAQISLYRWHLPPHVPALIEKVWPEEA